LFCFLALTVLANGQTNFYIQSIQENADGAITVTWPAVPTWTYHVMYADSPGGAWQDLSDGQLTAGTNVWTLCYTDTNSAAASQRFYKIRTTRPKLIMALVLDRSGSMNPATGTSMGGAYLPGAVSTFISNFDDNYDEAAMVSFATTATVDVPMGQPFKQAISAAVTNLNWCGGTFAQGGLTNALVQINNATVPPGQNQVKVVVFFTDGLANMIQDTLSCPTSITWNFGGYSTGSWVGFWNPATTTKSCSDQDNACGNGSSPIGCSPSCSATQFHSNQYNAMEIFTRANVTAEAQYRSIQVANDMRANNILVEAIGLGNETDLDMNFLSQIANATNSPTYDATQRTGQAIIANTPSDLQAVFQQIASKLLTY
jgi:hypothetical protein